PPGISGPAPGNSRARPQRYGVSERRRSQSPRGVVPGSSKREPPGRDSSGHRATTVAVALGVDTSREQLEVREERIKDAADDLARAGMLVQEAAGVAVRGETALERCPVRPAPQDIGDRFRRRLADALQSDGVFVAPVQE